MIPQVAFTPMSAWDNIIEIALLCKQLLVAAGGKAWVITQMINHLHIKLQHWQRCLQPMLTSQRDK